MVDNLNISVINAYVDNIGQYRERIDLGVITLSPGLLVRAQSDKVNEDDVKELMQQLERLPLYVSLVAIARAGAERRSRQVNVQYSFVGEGAGLKLYVVLVHVGQ